MASLEFVVARSRFNFPVKINQLFKDETVTLQSFETFGEFKSPKKFKIIVDNQGSIQEQVIELNLNEESNSYSPHYLGLMVNCSNVTLSIIGLTDVVTESKDTVSYKIIFENNKNDNDSDGRRESFPIKDVDIKLKTKKLKLK